MTNYNERIAAAKEKIEQYENQMKQLIQKQKVQERKDRTRRLIERGAMLEGFIPEVQALTNEQFKFVLLAAFHTTVAVEALKKVQDSAVADSSLV